MESHAETQRNRLNAENTLAVVKSSIENLEELQSPPITRQKLEKGCLLSIIKWEIKR